MWIRRFLVLVLSTILVAGCVSKSEFEAYKAEQDSLHAQIKMDGDSVDLYLEAAHVWFHWLREHHNIIDPDTDPPDLPPDPPPDGEWE